jgi:hypothetical protein
MARVWCRSLVFGQEKLPASASMTSDFSRDDGLRNSGRVATIIQHGQQLMADEQKHISALNSSENAALGVSEQL